MQLCNQMIFRHRWLTSGFCRRSSASITGGGFPSSHCSQYMETSSAQPSSRNDGGITLLNDVWQWQDEQETSPMSWKQNVWKSILKHVNYQDIKRVADQHEMLSFLHQILCQIWKPLCRHTLLVLKKERKKTENMAW